MSGDQKTYIMVDDISLTDVERGMLFRKTIKFGTKALTPDQEIEFYRDEIDYLASEVRKLEIENYELRQNLEMLELLIQDIRIGQAKGEMN
jgi:regulator of replication initiation timing